MLNGTTESLTCPLPKDVNTEGFVLKAKVHSAKVMDWDAIKTLVQRADEHFPRLKHLWVDVGFRGEDKGKRWALRRRSAGVWIWWSVLPPRTEEGARGMGLKQWSHEGVVVDWKKICARAKRSCMLS